MYINTEPIMFIVICAMCYHLVVITNWILSDDDHSS